MFLNLAPVQALELREAVARTLRASPDVGIVVEERRATGYEVERANGLFLPTVDFRAAAGEEFTNDATARAGILPRYESGLTPRQLLFDGAESKNKLALRTARVRSASRRVLETAQGVAIGVADVKQAESRLARAKDDRARARNRLDDADAAYRRVVGEAVESLIRPAAPVHALPGSVADTVALAVAANPAVRVARAEIAEARAEYRKSKSNFWPRVNLEIAGNSSRNVDGARGADTDVSALVVLNYNLYRGGADVAQRQAYIARLAKSRQGLRRAIRVVEEQARRSWNALRNGRDRVAALRDAVRANEIVRVTYREQFDINQRSLLDLLDSENDLFIAKANLITSEFTVLFGVYRVLATTGGLLAALDVAPPREAGDDGRRALALPAATPAVKSLSAPETKPVGRASPVTLGRIPPGLAQGRRAALAAANPPGTPAARRRVAAPIGRASPVAASIKRLPELPPTKPARP